MQGIFRLVGPSHAVEILGVKLVGATAENGKKLVFTIGFILAACLLSYLLTSLGKIVLRGRRNVRIEFWTRQAIQLTITILIIVSLLSIWFDDPTRLATALGLVSAGLAFALQKVVTSVAGYFVILRGNTFNVGDRIVMGGVRGDVIALSLIQTTILEMGQPPEVQSDSPAMWVRSRQPTGRIAVVTNDKIFKEPVFNYTREFPFIWEEMTLPISYTADRQRAERILLEAVERHTSRTSDFAHKPASELEQTYFVALGDLNPKVYFRLTSNWVELTVRFITPSHRIRDLKDAISRDLLAAMNEAGIGIASTTFEIVGLPPLRIQPAGGLSGTAAGPGHMPENGHQ